MWGLGKKGKGKCERGWMMFEGRSARSLGTWRKRFDGLSAVEIAGSWGLGGRSGVVSVAGMGLVWMCCDEMRGRCE